MSDESSSVRDLLKIALSAAVPLWIHELRQKPWSEVEALARESAQIVAEKGDVIQFKGKRKGETAAAFNGLAAGVAALAFAPGGVTFLDLRFEAVHPETEAERAILSGREYCPRCSSGPRHDADVSTCPDCGYKWAGPRLLE